MTYRVDLVPRVEAVLEELPESGHQEVIGLIAAVLVQSEVWPAPGGWDVAFGARSWVAFTTYADGIEVYDVGWAG
ncbi:hypothetical protein [Streptomyces sp. JB150]|uniref:hypothetical protein n=1 Tax=Streptomyces sp. JB150 TaxID=2714844 RepID=UPI001408EA08|nr:hypothetical protein [Streptomyces sp. JB150]QIJ62539.1 hypothetical protein G7Z13_11190 [Streptomyces sp. JB150]